MKVFKVANLLVLALILTLGATGCRKKPGYLTPLPGTRAQSVQDPDAGKALGQNDGTKDNIVSTDDPDKIKMSDPNLRKDWPRDRDILKAYTVHFDFDSSAVKESEKSKVAAVADWLKANAADAVEIEGHCDARGTEEYNRALGERRALALREELIRLGVDPLRIDTLSFGEDRPVAQGTDEAAYRQNRRGEFVVEKHP